MEGLSTEMCVRETGPCAHQVGQGGEGDGKAGSTLLRSRDFDTKRAWHWGSQSSHGIWPQKERCVL